MTLKRDPETYLKIANAEETKNKQGRLKIYLGAAPGVGKTYQMLSDALSLRAQGLDVVIGDVATHGRQEVESLASAFEKIPLIPIMQENFTIFALNLTAIIKRAPALVLVDEAAFSNPAGLQHPKRWQDIQELIEHGIDVCTTLNIQHLESLNDVITSLIGIPVYETVPDQFIEQASKLELVDLPSDELIARLKQGKVYVPSNISVAMQHFFKKKNLDALRELALRTVAEQIGRKVESDYAKSLSAQLLYKQDTLLVCVKNAKTMPKLIRAAKRLSARLKCKWIALFVDHGHQKDFAEVQAYLQLADSLGAKTQVIFSTDFIAAVKEYVELNHITQLVIGRTSSRFWGIRNYFKLLSNQLKDIGIYGIELEHLKATRWHDLFVFKFLNWWLVGLILGGLLVSNFFYRTSRSDFLPGFAEIILITVMGITFFYAKHRLKQARNIEQNNGFLIGFLQSVSFVRGQKNIINAAYNYFSDNLQLKLMVFLPKHQALKCVLPPDNPSLLNEKEMAIVQWVYQSGIPAGKGTGNLIFSDALFLPLKSSHGCQGVIRFEPKDMNEPMSIVQQKNLTVCMQQLANILDAEILQARLTQQDMSLTQEQVRHDLLENLSQQLYPPFQHLLQLLPHGLESSPYTQLLNRLNNHLKVIRYFSDEHLLKTLSLQNIQELIGDVLARHSAIWKKVPVRWYVQKDLPQIPIQLDLMNVVIENILDNIYQHAHIEEGVEISIHQKQHYLLISFADFGPGFSETEVQKLFDYFYQVNALETNGLGLGLAICARIISWHKGKIWAENRQPRGAIFNFILPLENSNLNGQNNEPNV